MNTHSTRVIIFIGAICFAIGCFSEDECDDSCEGDSESQSEPVDNGEGEGNSEEEDTETDTETNTVSCTENIHCNDDDPCNGDEICDEEECKSGPLDEYLTDGTNCGTDKECFDGICLDFNCGDNNVSSNEDCDDGNDVTGDGCESDCTWTCVQASDCDDSNICNGAETCDQHLCQPGVSLNCNDANNCTADSCDNGLAGGCLHTLIDNDSDGYADSSLGDCGSYKGDDCNDSDDDIHPGHDELCDSKDNDCNQVTDDISDSDVAGAKWWYQDCDGDGHSPSATAGKTLSCEEPENNNCESSVGWTDNAPGANTDCHDGNADVFPGQTDYFLSKIPGTDSMDYNCDGDETGSMSYIESCSIAQCTSRIKGWKQSIPACGLLGTTVQCEWENNVCMTNDASMIACSCH